MNRTDFMNNPRTPFSIAVCDLKCYIIIILAMSGYNE